MKKNKFLNVIITLLILIILIGVSYAFFAYSRVSNEISKVVTGDIYMHYVENNELELLNAFPQTKEEGILNEYFEFNVSGKNTTKNKDIYYAVNIVYGEEQVGMNRYHDEDIVFYLTEVVDGEEVVLIDCVQYKIFNDAKIYVETIPNNTTDEIEHTYRLRMWINEDVLISDTSEDANYTTGEYKNSYTSVKVNVEGNLSENDINMVLDANDDNYVNGKRAIYADIYGYTDDELILEVTSDNENIEFLYVDEYENSIEESVSILELNYRTNKKDVITTRVIPISKNDTNTKTKLTFKLTRNGEVVEQQVKSVTVYGNNFCLNNGFNKLYDCILASEAMSSSVESAKTFIANKGEPNLNDTAPSYTYVEDITYDVENVYSVEGYQFYFSDSYEFDNTTGIFKLYNSDGSGIILDTLSDDYKNYYTCGGTNYGYTSCSMIYRIDSTSNDDEIYTITQGDLIKYKVSTTLDSEVGLYKTEDDYGDVYFYRGDVSNNNVYFGGLYWKIMRTNGDDSIRLIYYGSSSDKFGIIPTTYSNEYPDGSSIVPSRYADPTYVGYMYGKNFELQVSDTINFANFQPLTKYYFADGYEFDSENEVFKLKMVNLEPVSGTFEEMKELYDTYPYTCLSTEKTGSCEVLLQINNIYTSTIDVKYISYSSINLDDTRTNEFSSKVKKNIDNWYKNNFVGKIDNDGQLITNYIVDGTFCNDRSITDTTYNSGYLLSQDTRFSSYNRLAYEDKTASLKCGSDTRDRFSSTTERGNGLLTYPVALVTADEVAFAGGKHDTKNGNYYLYINNVFWTMSPSLFQASSPHARVWTVVEDGRLTPWNRVSPTFGARPVINLSADVLISSGDGSIESPYELKLN